MILFEGENFQDKKFLRVCLNSDALVGREVWAKKLAREDRTSLGRRKAKNQTKRYLRSPNTKIGVESFQTRPQLMSQMTL